MENASKALIIAGGVLIAIMIIGLGVYVTQGAGELAQSYEEKAKIDKMNAFNNQFLLYNRDITAQDMVTLVNLIKESNKVNEMSSQMQVTLYIDGSKLDVDSVTEDWKISIMQSQQADQEPRYEVISIKYNDSGYVNQLKYKTR